MLPTQHTFTNVNIWSYDVYPSPKVVEVENHSPKDLGTRNTHLEALEGPILWMMGGNDRSTYLRCTIDTADGNQKSG